MVCLWEPFCCLLLVVVLVYSDVMQLLWLCLQLLLLLLLRNTVGHYASCKGLHIRCLVVLLAELTVQIPLLLHPGCQTCCMGITYGASTAAWLDQFLLCAGC